MCCCDGDPPKAFRCVERRARKAHRCCECGRTIGAGEVYEHASGVWDGGPDAFKTCGRCARVRRALDADFHCVCRAPFTALREALRLRTRERHPGRAA